MQRRPDEGEHRIEQRAEDEPDASGALLYAVFTFVWSPLHYIHLMFVTLLSTLAVILIVDRWLSKRAPRVVAATAR